MTQEFFTVSYQPNPVMTELYEGLDNPSHETLGKTLRTASIAKPQLDTLLRPTMVKWFLFV